jgi:serine/threonine-protein kinase
LPVAEACEYVRQIALGLQHAADQGVVHRDIKPHNLMIVDCGLQIAELKDNSAPCHEATSSLQSEIPNPKSEIVKILDFGLGRLVDLGRDATRLTTEGQILGTLTYLSPEQAANSAAADIRSDIYSLGCTFYFLLAGAPPFHGRNAAQLLNNHASQQPLPIRSLRSDVPAPVSDLLDRMLAKQPNQRPQQPRDIALALSPYATSTGAAPSPAVDGAAARAEHVGLTPRRSPALRAILTPAVLLPLVTILACLLWLLTR